MTTAPTMTTLQELLPRIRKRGDQPCLVSLERDTLREHRASEMAGSIEALAYGLVQAGIKPGDFVVLLAKNRAEWLIACLAVIHSGAAVVPLDTQISNANLQSVLTNSEPRLIFTTTEYVNRLQQLELAQPLRIVLLDVATDDSRSWQALLPTAPANGVVVPQVQPTDTAAMFYTSGTTGAPKGVPLTHRNLAFQLTAIEQTGLVEPTDRVLLPLPMYHVYPFTVGTLAPITLGVPIILPFSLTGPQLLRALKEGEVTIIVGVPRLYQVIYNGIDRQIVGQGALTMQMFKRLMDTSIFIRKRFNKKVGKVLFKSLHERFGTQLRVLASGGSAIDPDLVWKLEGLGWQIAIGYGLTETSPLLTMNLPRSGDPLRAAAAGKPLPGIELRIDTTAAPDPDDGSEASQGSGGQPLGEILVRGPSVFSGYYNLPDQTAKAFTDDGQWFRTGDLGYQDKDGFVYISGRASTLIVTAGGKNVQPEPVEDAYAANKFIREIGVLQDPDDERLVALIVPEVEEVNRWRNGDTAFAIREAVSEQSALLPSYQRIDHYEITPEELPKTNLGKIRRHLLKEQYLRTKRGEVREAGPARPLAIADMTEADQQLLADGLALQLWEWLGERFPDMPLTLDTSPQLDLGIDSLAWLNLTTEIRELVGVELAEEATGRIDTLRDLIIEVQAAAEAAGEVQGAEQALQTPEAVLSEDQQYWLTPKSGALDQAGVVLSVANQQAMRAMFRLQSFNVEKVPVRPPFVLAPNHISNLDPMAVAAALPYTLLHTIYWAASIDLFFTSRPSRLFSRIAQMLPVAGARTVSVNSSLAFAALTLKQGKSLVWFPEGRLSPTGELLPFRQGLGYVLEAYPVPVVPVYIHGTNKALPRGEVFPRLAPVQVIFGDPCDPRQLANEGSGSSVPERIMNALHDKVAALIPELRSRVGTAAE